MKRLNIRSALFLVAASLATIIAAGCLGAPIQRVIQAQGEPAASIGQPFTIKGAETRALDGGKLSVTFEAVKGDSRCAIDVTCIWEGDATVILRLKETGRDGESMELHTSSRFATDASYGNYRVKLQDLKPQPRSTSPIDQKAYTATLVITRAK
jgi:hypothetical protein